MNGSGFADLAGPEGFGLAALIGVLFGFWLERAGFGSSRKLAAIFYRRDFAVLKVMFTAIATAAIGVELLDAAGRIDAEAIHRPETNFGPQIAGGLIFGLGFVMGGWCPGTALVGLASGRLDALAFLAGAMGGSLAFMAAWPAIADFMTVGSRGVATLPGLAGIDGLTASVLVLALALASFAAARALQRRDPPTERSAP
jgi:uncharacterized membrane protein YedE/YeeE